MKYPKLLTLIALISLSACNKEDESSNDNNAQLTFQFQFDENQERLDGFGNPIQVATGNAAQSPDFNSMSVHYIELVPSKFTMVEQGTIVYTGETQVAASSSNFDDAIKWDEARVAGANETFLEVNLSDLEPGTYEYLRTSVTYQNTDVKFNLRNLPAPLPQDLMDQNGTLAGFIGFNTYIGDLQVKEHSVTVNADKPQGFWAFETRLDDPYQELFEQNTDPISTGQAPAGSTTVVNPLAEFGVTLPQGSCIVTGQLETPLTITGEETEDIKITLSFSINQSFEWIDNDGNGEWDFYISGGEQEPVVDMGLRGLVVKVD